MKGVHNMPWNLDSDRPIYLQLMERIQHDIISGTYRPGDKLPSVRELAMDASVNPNTMQKALTELENMKLIYTERTNGKFVTNDTKLINEFKQKYADDLTFNYVKNMKNLGYKIDEIIEIIKESEEK